MNFVSKFDGSLPFTGTHPKAQTHVETVHGNAPADAIVVKDANLLFNGDYKRAGTDLVISKDDQDLVLSDYFKGDKRAPLASPDGAWLTGKIIETLTGHVQTAQADGSASIAPKIIGHVTKMTGNATVIRNGVSIILNNGDNVHQGDVVQSGSNSTVGITFIDGSVFGLASNAKMVLNEMVYDPNGSNNSSLMSLVSGTISFVAGATAKHGDMKVDTPVATMGIRGTAVLVEIDFEIMQVLPNPNQVLPQLAPPVRFQVLVEPDGTSGSYVLLDRTTLAPMATVNQPGTVTSVSGSGAVSFLSSAQLSPELMKLISEVFSQKFTDNSNPRSDTHFTDTVIPDNSFPVRFANGDTGTVTLRLVFGPEGVQGPNTAAARSNDHVPGAPGISISHKVAAERVALTASPLADSVSGQVSYSDINTGDQPTVSTAFHHFGYLNADGQDVTNSLTAAQRTAIGAVSVPLSVAQDPNLKNTGTATWTYSVPDHALDFLAAGETLTLTYMARVDNNFAQNNEFSLAPFTITITGTNDKPTIVVNQTDISGGVVEDSNTGNLTTDGIITFNDVDLTDTHTSLIVLKSSHASPGLPGFADGTALGVLTLDQISETAGDGDTTGSVVWTYTLDDDNPVLQSLAEGQTITLVYTVTFSDGHGGTVTQDVTITVKGSNDSPNHPPVIVGELTDAVGGVTEDVAVSDTTHQIADDGIITFRDIDLIDTHTADFVPVSAHSTLPGFEDNPTFLGHFALDDVNESPLDTNNLGSVNWTFTLHDDDPVLQSLAEGQTITQVYRVTITDNHNAGVDQDVTITITGTNDAPTIVASSTTATGAVTEDSNVNSGKVAIGGTIGFKDVDLIDTHKAAATLLSSNATADLPGFDEGTGAGADSIGTLSLTVNENATDQINTGSVGWTFTVDNSTLQSLAVNQSITQVYRVMVSDGHGGSTYQDVAVTINGTNDDPTIVSGSTTSTGAVTEDSSVNGQGKVTKGGSIGFQDVDLIDAHTAAATLLSSNATADLPGFDEGVGAGAASIGTLTLTVNENITDEIDTGSVGWTYTVDNSILQSLAVNQSITQVYRVTVSDGHGGSAYQDVTVTITGVNDDPTITAETTLASTSGAVVEDGKQTASGTIAFQDVDLIDTHLVSKALTGGVASVALPGFNVATQPLGVLDLVLDENPGDTDNIGTVNWTFTIDNTLAQQLAVGQVITQTYTVTIDDKHGGVITQPVTVTITGTNDNPTITAETTLASTSGAVVEDGKQTDSGTITFQDVDLIDTHLVSKALTGGTASSPLPGFDPATQPLGTLMLALHENAADTGNTGTVDWTFTIDNALAQQLAVGQVITQTYTVTIDDKHGGVITQPVTVTITGTNDDPTITAETTLASTSGAVVEDGKQTDSGTIKFQDVDLIDTHLFSSNLTGGSASIGLPGFNPATQPLGTLQLVPHENNGDTSNIGTVDWTFTINNALAQQLAVGQVITQTYTVTIDDKHGGAITQPVTVTITGTDDDPTITAATTTASTSGAVVEDGQQTASGTITFQDVDLIDTHLFSSNLTGGSASVGLPGFNPATQPLGTLQLVPHENNGDTGNIGTVDWTFTINNALAQQLAVGQVITQTYTVEIDDQHGGIITQPVTVTITGTNDAPVVTPGAAQVSEEGLPNGVPDTLPAGLDTTNSTSASGTITATDVDKIDTLTMSLGTPSASLTSGGVAITWTLQDAGHTLIGKAGTATIITATITDAGGYNVVLSGPIDHSTASQEDNSAFAVPVIVSDGHTTTPTTLSVTIEDDSPKAGPVEVPFDPPESQTNVMLILDLSGSMDDSSGLTGLTRLDVAKAAINELLEQYDNRGDVMVRIVTFSDTGAAVGSVWLSVTDAKAAIAGLSAGGATNYDTALLTAMEAFTAGNRLTGPDTRNVSYFLSDGDPTAGHGVTASQQGVWESFLTTNKIVSFGLGIPSVSTPANLAPIAFDPAPGTQAADTPIIVTDLGQLASTLVFTIPPVVGGVLSGAVGAAPNSFGADGGFVQSITVDGVTYTFNPAANGGAGGITTSGGGFIYDGTTKTLTVDTNTNLVGGELAMVMTSGAFTFQPSADLSSESVGFVLVDRDGDTASSTLHFSGPDRAPVVRDDHVITNISGGSGTNIVIPDAALLYNDSDADGQTIAITGAITNVLGATSVTHASGNVTFTDNNTNGGSFSYTGSTTSPGASDTGGVTVDRSQTGSTLTGTGLGEILIGRNGTNNTINANEGNDVLIGGTGNDSLTGGAGADMMTGGGGVDTFIINSGQSRGTVGGSGDAGTISGYDVITDFGTAADILNLQGTPAAATGTNVNGTDSALTVNGQTIKSHTILNGVISFDDANSFGSPLTLSSAADVAAAVDYLHRNDLGSAGATVAFVANIGGTAHTYVFEQVGNSPNAANDILVDLAGLTLSNLTALIPSRILPAGVSGNFVNLGLTDPVDHLGSVTVAIAGVPSGWTLSEGTNNDDGSWTIQANSVSMLSIASPAEYTGAMTLQLTMNWTNTDGSSGFARVTDNVEFFAQGAPIFAWSGEDHLTGSSGSDLFVFSQPIGHNTVYSFDAAQDQIDLIGYAGFADFADILTHLTQDADGDAVIALGDGQSIELRGVHAATLTGSNFVFDQTPMFNNAGTMTIGDGALIPLTGTFNNTGTIALNSSGDETELQLTAHGLTLEGGGKILLSDSDSNVIDGTSTSVTLRNEDNTISGAGQLGNGELSLINSGTINATGSHALTIDTGSNIIVNSGILEASGTGGLVVESSIANSGLLWANGGTLTVQGAVIGAGNALIEGGGTLDFEAASTANVVFGSAASETLRLGDSFHFNGTITGFAASDKIDLADFGSAAASISYLENPAGTGGTLTVSDGVQSVELSLVGHYTIGDFSIVADEARGTLITHAQHYLV